jgi:hypothetical protein
VRVPVRAARGVERLRHRRRERRAPQQRRRPPVPPPVRVQRPRRAHPPPRQPRRGAGALPGRVVPAQAGGARHRQDGRAQPHRRRRQRGRWSPRGVRRLPEPRPRLVLQHRRRRRRAVARMWLWDGRGAAPARVTESMVEYLVSSGAGEEDEQQCMSARFLRHLEQRRGGFVARLNRAMRDRWSDAGATCLRGVPRGGDGEARRYVWVQCGSVRKQLLTKGSLGIVQCFVSMNSWLVVSEVSLSGSTAVSVGDAIICDCVCTQRTFPVPSGSGCHENKCMAQEASTGNHVWIKQKQ